MPIGAITMILTNVGLQIYNNWCGSRQNDKLQQKREEFERAARERNTEHMWKLLREGQEMTLQLEKEKHDDRLKELKDEVDHLLERLTYEATITNWPLKVLPIVMKNQAFGNLLANQEEHVALHVIFTRSNYDKFNKLVYPIIEKELEQYCDKHWSTMTDHPVLFYSGAWKPMSNPTDVQVTAMREELKNLPTLLITPFFRPGDDKLVFQVHMWGVGPNSADKFIVPEIEPVSDEFHFQRTYTNQQDYENEVGLLDEIVEDLVPYLECMIGYMADTYFWSSAGLAPHLPLLVTNGTINTDGMKYLLYDSCVYYVQLLDTSLENTKANPFAQNKLHNLYLGSAELWDEETKKSKSKECLLSSVFSLTGKRFSCIEDLYKEKIIQEFDKDTVNRIVDLLYSYGYKDGAKTVSLIKGRIEQNKNNDKAKEIEYIVNSDVLNSTDILYLKDLVQKGDCAAMYRLGEIYEFSISPNTEYNKKEATHYYNLALEKGSVLSMLYKILSEDNISEESLRYLHDNIGYIQELASKKVTIAVIRLSQLYYLGYGVEKNLDTARKVLESVDYPQHPYYYYWAAKLLITMFGNQQAKSIEYHLQKSADMGYVVAQSTLSSLYSSGTLLQENPKLSFEYAKSAASQGSVDDIVKVACFYLKGYGVARSQSNAKYLLEIAAREGNSKAKNLLNQL